MDIKTNCAVCGIEIKEGKTYTLIIEGKIAKVCYACYKAKMGDEYWD